MLLLHFISRAFECDHCALSNLVTTKMKNMILSRELERRNDTCGLMSLESIAASKRLKRLPAYDKWKEMNVYRYRSKNEVVLV